GGKARTAPAASGRFSANAKFHVGWHGWPCGACAPEPAPKTFREYARRIKSIGWNKNHAHESTRRVGFNFEERANLFGGHFVYHWFCLNIEPAFATLRRSRRRTAKVFASRRSMSNIHSSPWRIRIQKQKIAQA